MARRESIVKRVLWMYIAHRFPSSMDFGELLLIVKFLQLLTAILGMLLVAVRGRGNQKIKGEAANLERHVIYYSHFRLQRA